MAHVTGTVSSYTDLKEAIKTAVSANGWTVTGDIVSKGDVNVRFQVGNPFASGTQQGLVASIATAISGGSLSGSICTQGARVGTFDTTTANAMTFPATYRIFINTNPDEVYVVVNYSVNAYQWLAFGKNPAPGLVGTGIWLGATFGAAPTLGSSRANRSGTTRIGLADTGGGDGNQDATGAGLFANTMSGNLVGYSICNTAIHSGIGTDGGWSVFTGNIPNAFSGISDFIVNTPNTWNSQAVLIRICPTSSFIGSNKIQILANIEHSRYLRINNLNPGDIITLGPDRWMVFPFYIKGATNTKGLMDTTGWYGWALRYDGP